MDRRTIGSSKRSLTSRTKTGAIVEVVVVVVVAVVVVEVLPGDNGIHQVVTAKLAKIVVVDLPEDNGNHEAKVAHPAGSGKHLVVVVLVVVHPAGRGNQKGVSKTATIVVEMVPLLPRDSGNQEVKVAHPEGSGNHRVVAITVINVGVVLLAGTVVVVVVVVLPAGNGNQKVLAKTVTILLEMVPVLPKDNGSHGREMVDSKAGLSLMTVINQKVRVKGNG